MRIWVWNDKEKKYEEWTKEELLAAFDIEEEEECLEPNDRTSFCATTKF